MTPDDAAAPTHPTEEDAQKVLWGIFDLVDAAQAALTAGTFWPDVGRGSQMQGDNRKTAPLQMAHSLQTLISVSVEHLHALAALVRKANMLHNTAPFTLARSAVESAATAFWMLQLPGGRERVKRLVIYQRQDRFDYDTTAKLIQERVGGDLPPTLEKRKVWIADIISNNRIDLPERTRLEMTDVLQEVDRAIDGTTHFETYWRTASAFAHGRQWAQVNALIRTDLTPVAPGVARAQVSSTMGRVLWGASAAFELADRATKLYIEACRARR